MPPPPLSRFRDLALADLNVEYQVHTVQTDGKATIQEILAMARNRRLAAIAFTEHVRRETDWFSEFSAAVKSAAEAFSEIKVYVGCEAKALDKNGTLDVTAEILEMSDLVLGSVHRFPDDKSGYINWKLLSDEQFAQIEFELALGLLEYAPIHILSHPGGMYQRQRKKPFPEAYLRSMMETSIERGIAIEINTSYTLDLRTFLRLCKEINPYISIGSDAHTLQEIGRCAEVLRDERYLWL